MGQNLTSVYMYWPPNRTVDDTTICSAYRLIPKLVQVIRSQGSSSRACVINNYALEPIGNGGWGWVVRWWGRQVRAHLTGAIEWPIQRSVTICPSFTHAPIHARTCLITTSALLIFGYKTHPNCSHFITWAGRKGSGRTVLGVLYLTFNLVLTHECLQHSGLIWEWYTLKLGCQSS